MEAKEKHATFTPGPWKVSSHQTQIHSERYGLVAALQRFTEKSTTHANARLIAAAPELLEQCKLFEKVLTYYYGTVTNTAISATANENRDKLREILAKVEGGEG